MSKELNEKIAKWCGWQYHINESQPRKWFIPSPYNVWTWQCPNFTSSMDVILKWAIPKLTENKFVFNLDNESGVCSAVIQSMSKRYATSNDSLPMAFCLALDKYINEQGNG